MRSPSRTSKESIGFGARMRQVAARRPGPDRPGAVGPWGAQSWGKWWALSNSQRGATKRRASTKRKWVLMVQEHSKFVKILEPAGSAPPIAKMLAGY